MSDTATEATTALAFVTAILKELDARDAGFAKAVFGRVEADIALHRGVFSYHDALVEGLELVRSEVGKTG